MAFFREFMLAMQGRGHEVGIVTAHRDIHSEADLLLLKELRFSVSAVPTNLLSRMQSSRRKRLESRGLT
jgi:hypothetical protein